LAHFLHCSKKNLLQCEAQNAVGFSPRDNQTLIGLSAESKILRDTRGLAAAGGRCKVVISTRQEATPRALLPFQPAQRHGGAIMGFRIGDVAPDFEADTTQGRIRFHDWIGNSWAIMFSHPKDFTPVCTTELGQVAKMKADFDKRNVKIIGISVDSVDDHNRWAKDIEETMGKAPNYPMIGDPDLKVAKLYDMLPAETAGGAQGRTPAQNATVRNVYVIGPDKKIKLMITYPMTTGRNFDEVLRVIDSLQLTAKHSVATPVNWKPGEKVIIAGSVSDEDAKKKFPQGWKAPKPYLRIVDQPK
jgi:alkyl hydroperoxide reductase subunit AhpC